VLISEIDCHWHNINSDGTRCTSCKYTECAYNRRAYKWSELNVGEQVCFSFRNSSYFSNYERSKLRFLLWLQNSKFFNRIIHRRLWTKVHEISKLVKKRQGMSTANVWRGGYSRKVWENSKKIWNFHTCTCIGAHRVYIQRSKVNVEHTSCRPFSSGCTAVLSVQKFASIPEL